MPAFSRERSKWQHLGPEHPAGRGAADKGELAHPQHCRAPDSQVQTHPWPSPRKWRHQASPRISCLMLITMRARQDWGGNLKRRAKSAALLPVHHLTL